MKFARSGRWTRRPAGAFALALFLSCLAVVPATASVEKYRRGPVVLEETPTLGDAAAYAGKKALVRDALPEPFLEAAKKLLDGGNGVLLVGHTDTVGPKLLNRSLGLQYAVETAYRLSDALGAEPWKFFCLTVGEVEGREEPGVELFAWSLPQPPPAFEPSAISVLSPPPGEGVGNRFWPVWDPDANAVLWASSGEGSVESWEIGVSGFASAFYYPARSPNAAIGGTFDGRGQSSDLHWKVAATDPRLHLRVESLEPGWARLSAKVPSELRDTVVWAAGIPYPVTVEWGKLEVNVARFPTPADTYVQAVNPRGETVVGPVLSLPGSPEVRPKLLAVLVWDSDRTDLDLHGWSKGLHTHPQDPDPALSIRVIPGTRLLFDGSGLRRASALVAETVEDIQLEVTCYSDFGGGTDAFLYVVSDPGDPVKRSGLLLGPRRLSSKPTEERWPALQWKGNQE